MKFLPLAALTTLALTLGACQSIPPVEATETIEGVPARDLDAYNVQGNLALEGYDPVSYWPEGGSMPLAGEAARSVNYGGIVYFFANDANLAAFKANPAKYEPAHGGWCSYAMKGDSEFGVNPQTFILRDDRIFFFYNEGDTNTKSLWEQEDHAEQTEKADGYWAERTVSRAQPLQPRSGGFQANGNFGCH